MTNQTDMDFNGAIKAHSAWKTKLRDAISSQSTLDVETIARDDCCALGKWLHGEHSQARFGAFLSYAECVRLHADFHKIAGKVAAVINDRKYHEAEKMLEYGTPYYRASNAAIVAISELKQEAADELSLHNGLKASLSGVKVTSAQVDEPLMAKASGNMVSGLHQTNAMSWPAQLVAVASITLELSAVVVIAKEISLAAANAKAIAFRAGDKAKGFLPITDFINELAKETIGRVATINELASLLFMMTVHDYRKTMAHKKIAQAKTLAGAATYAPSIEKALDIAKIRMEDCLRKFKRDAAVLSGHLEEVIRNAQTARTIAIYSRIEASQAGEYLQSLQTVAESVDSAAQAIHEHVQRCITVLSVFSKC